MNKQTEKHRATISFIAIGCFRAMQEMIKLSHDKYDILSDTYSGQMGVVDEVTQYCYNIEKAWKRKKNKEIDYVWDYDVSEEFGYIVTYYLADGIEFNAEEVIKGIVDELEAV